MSATLLAVIAGAFRTWRRVNRNLPDAFLADAGEVVFFCRAGGPAVQTVACVQWAAPSHPWCVPDRPCRSSWASSPA